jgi:DNA-binding NarL/FixJ family response regulator
VAVVDIDLPGMDGITATAGLRERVPPARIAAELFLPYGTVRNYLAAAEAKLAARNRVDAIRIASESGWL